jgi:tetratricopeptide (TPR) repeat protein
VDFFPAARYAVRMPEKSMTEVPRDLRDLYQKGATALQRQNFDYAVAIFNQVLQREPAFFECRQALRAAQFKKAGGSTSFFKKVLGGASSSPLIAKAQIAKLKNPLEAIQVAEQILSSDPNNSAAHKILAESALEADLPRTACLEYEILIKQSPKDTDLVMDYGKALAAAGQVSKAEAVYGDLLRAHPANAEIGQALKDLSARKTMQEGGYDALADGKGSYRDILKNKDEATSLEQEKREVKTDEVADRLIREKEQIVVREPKNLKALRDLAELYLQKKNYDRALEYCDRIKSAETGTDPSLDRLVADITSRKYDAQMARLDPTAPDYAEQSARVQAEKQAFQLNECKARAERYPTDLQIRFELGELYFQGGKTTEAIGEFQKAQANPQRRLQALGYLGQCFARRGMNDSAVRMLQTAIKEKQVMDDEKKEFIYQLGAVLEKIGKREEAIEQFKQIYEMDISYKDVAAKVDAYYAGQQ